MRSGVVTHIEEYPSLGQLDPKNEPLKKLGYKAVTDDWEAFEAGLKLVKEWEPKSDTFFLRYISRPHLAKRPSDLKENGTQEKTPFSGAVFQPFHMVCSVLLRVLPSKTIDWKLLIGCQRISTSQKVVF